MVCVCLGVWPGADPACGSAAKLRRYEHPDGQGHQRNGKPLHGDPKNGVRLLEQDLLLRLWIYGFLGSAATSNTGMRMAKKPRPCQMIMSWVPFEEIRIKEVDIKINKIRL